MTLESRLVDFAQAVGADIKNISTVLQGTKQITISPTAPIAPSNGDLWLDSTDLSISIFYNDGDSSQWVVLTGSQAPSDTIEETNPTFTYSGGLVSRIDYASGNYKTFTYTAGVLSETQYFRLGKSTITKTFLYNPDGTLASVTQTEL